MQEGFHHLGISLLDCLQGPTLFITEMKSVIFQHHTYGVILRRYCCYLSHLSRLNFPTTAQHIYAECFYMSNNLIADPTRNWTEVSPVWWLANNLYHWLWFTSSRLCFQFWWKEISQYHIWFSNGGDSHRKAHRKGRWSVSSNQYHQEYGFSFRPISLIRIFQCRRLQK